MKYIATLIMYFLPLTVLAEDKVLHIYQDADISSHSESSVAIQRGIEVAFDEIGNEIDGYKVAFKYLDHRGNVIRSKRNYQRFIDDPKALVIYSGIHSPPLIKNRAFINENKALTLVPWAAGGPITRHPSPENWVFRLSIDDTQAGSVIIDFAMKKKQCKAPHLLLEGTPWGDSNLKNMSKALLQYNIKSPRVSRFNWNLKEKGAKRLLRDIINDGSDCVVLVSNSIEGVVLVNEMVSMDEAQRLPIISHWGITGGDFHEKIPSDMREKIDLHFIQTCFAFTNVQQSRLAQQVFERLKIYSGGEMSKPADLKSAVGFIHAYDLTKLLIASIKQAGLTGDIVKDRDRVRMAFENLKGSVHGLVKTYNKPFSVFDLKTNNNAHEALQKDHYCMGHYGENDEILIVQ